MTPEELEASLRQTRWDIYESPRLLSNAWRALDHLTKVISYLVEENLSLSSKLDEMQSRLSTLERGSTKPEESPRLTGRREISIPRQYRSW